MIDLRHGPWQTALADVTDVDTLIVDAPFSKRVHDGNTNIPRADLNYGSMEPDDIDEYVEHWSPRVKMWIVSITSHDLYPHWRAACERAGRYVFAPIPIVDVGMTVRFRGDGPSSWTCWAMVARPRSKKAASWGTVRGAYIRGSGDKRSPHRGGKPLGVMRQIVEDYSREGDLVLDTHAGGGTTLIAALQTDRRAVGAELNEEAHARAAARIGSPDTW